MNQEQMDGIYASKLAAEAIKVRINKLMDLATDKRAMKKLPRQHARIILACKRAKQDGTPITEGMFRVLAHYA